MSKLDEFASLQKQAEFYYSRGQYKTAKSMYEEMLKLTRNGTIKQGLVLSCISDQEEAIEKNLRNNIDNAIKEIELTDKIQDVIKNQYK